MTGTALLTLWLVHVAAVVSPGPSFVVVTRAAVAGSVGHGVAVAAGLALGTLLWALAALFGLAALFALVPSLYVALRVGGALFLLFIAYQVWRHAPEPPPAPLGSDGADDGSLPRALRLGVLTQLANPKVAVFFGSIFAAVLPADPGPSMVAASFAIVCADEFVWYALLALLFSRPGVRRAYARAKTPLDRACALVLAAIALGLLIPG